jgi:hypothetical protein
MKQFILISCTIVNWAQLHLTSGTNWNQYHCRQCLDLCSVCHTSLSPQVMGIDKDFASAYAKAQIAAGQKLPTKGGKVFLTMADKYKKDIIPIARDLGNLGFGLVATCASPLLMLLS